MLNVYVREDWRYYSYFIDKVEVMICGLGVFGYIVVIEFVVKYIKLRDNFKIIK